MWSLDTWIFIQKPFVNSVHFCLRVISLVCKVCTWQVLQDAEHGKCICVYFFLSSFFPFSHFRILLELSFYHASSQLHAIFFCILMYGCSASCVEPGVLRVGYCLCCKCACASVYVCPYVFLFSYRRVVCILDYFFGLLVCFSFFIHSFT